MNAYTFSSGTHLFGRNGETTGGSEQAPINNATILIVQNPSTVVNVLPDVNFSYINFTNISINAIRLLSGATVNFDDGVNISNITKTATTNANIQGSAIFVNASKLSFRDVTISNNSIVQNYATNATTGAYGAALHVIGTTTNEAISRQHTTFNGNTVFENNSIKSNASGAMGGAIYVLNNYTFNFNESVLFKGNTVERTSTNIIGSGTILSGGSAIYSITTNVNNRPKFYFNKDTSFIENGAKTRIGNAIGGAILSTLSIYNFKGNTLFDSNYTNSSNTAVNYISSGGAIRSEGSTFSFNGNTTFSNNVSEIIAGTNGNTAGGAINAVVLSTNLSTFAFEGTTLFKNNKLINGVVAQGGAFRANQGSGSFSGTTIFDGNSISGATNSQGGAMSLDNT